MSGQNTELVMKLEGLFQSGKPCTLLLTSGEVVRCQQVYEHSFFGSKLSSSITVRDLRGDAHTYLTSDIDDVRED